MKKQIKFSKSNSIKDASHAVLCTREWLEAQLDSLEVLALCESVRQGHEEDKQKLPVACFHATFSDQHRHEESAVPSGLVSIDVDDHDGSLGLNPREFYLAHIEPRLKNELSKVLFVYITASGKGLRIVAERTGLATLAEEQEHLFDLACPGLSRDALDSSTKDLARASYLTTRQDVLFADFDRLFGGTVELLEPTTSKEESEEEESHEGELPILPEIREKISEDHQKLGEVYYKDLVNELIDRLKKAGAKGNRNNQVYKLACDLRHVCLTPEQIESLIPHFGLTDAEFKSTIQSACKELKPNSPLPFFLSQILENLNPELKEERLPPVLPTKLPKGMKEILAPYLEYRRPALAICALTALAQLACHARFDFQSSEDPDYKGDMITFIVCLVGEPATGKSSMVNMIDRLLLPIQKQDKIIEEQRQEYNDELNAESSNRRKKKNPHFDLTIVPANTTQAAFFEMVNNAKDHSICSVTPEIDAYNDKNSWAQNRSIFRLAFDHDLAGQRRQSSNAVSVYKPLFLNAAMSGTPDRVQRFFANTVDGTITRIAFVQYLDVNGKFTKSKDSKDGKRSCKNQKYISELIDRLMNESTPETPYRIPKIVQALEDWCDEKGYDYENFFPNNKALDIFRRRTHTIGIYAGAIAFLLENHRESETAINFALWAAEFILYYQLKLWGNSYNETIDANRRAFSVTANVSSNQILFLKLKAIFQESELRELAIANGYKSSSYRKILERWQAAGFVNKLEQKGNWFQKTERGIQEANLLAQKLKTPSLTYNKPDKVA